MNSPSILTTPIRERNQTYRSDLSSHSSSPTTLRVAHSSGSSSNAPGPSTTPLTVQSLLATCSTSSDPKLAALEHAVSDRNTLCSQNSQLWKLIEKQRAGYAQLLKELERVRGERDLFRAKLLETGQNTDALLKAHREKEKRAGKDASLRSAASHTHLRSSESNGSSGSGSGSAALDPRTNIARTKSDDIGGCIRLIVYDRHLSQFPPLFLFHSVDLTVSYLSQNLSETPLLLNPVSHFGHRLALVRTAASAKVPKTV